MTHGILTLFEALFQEKCIFASVGDATANYNSKSDDSDFHPELFLCHSPLLKEFSLISVPPLTDMLKFSRFPGSTTRSFKKCEGLLHANCESQARVTIECCNGHNVLYTVAISTKRKQTLPLFAPQRN